MIPQRAGNLDKKVTIQRRVETPDDTGDLLVTWTDHATVWAHFAPQNGAEVVAEGQIHANRLTRITIRYRGDLEATDRLMWDSVPHNIEAILQREFRRDETTLLVNDGMSSG